MGRANRDDQIVVVQFAVIQRDATVHRIDGARFGQDHAHVAPTASHRANGVRDVAGAKRRGCHLVEQRLKQVVIAPIDESYPHQRGAQFGQAPRRLQAAKTATNDDDMGNCSVGIAHVGGAHDRYDASPGHLGAREWR